MIEALAWGTAAGLGARWMVPGRRLALVTVLPTGLAGCVLGYLVAHQLLGFHELHLFEAQGFIPAVLGAVTLVALSRAVSARATRRSRRFGPRRHRGRGASFRP